MRNKLLIIFILLAIMAPWFIMAEINVTVGDGIFTLPRPFGATTAEDLITSIVNILIALALVVAPLMIVLGAYQLTTAGDNANKIKQGREIIVWAATGLAGVFLSKAIINLVNDIFGPLATTVGPEEILGVFDQVTNYFVALVILVAVIMIIKGGFDFLSAGANTEKVSRGRKTLIWGVLGLALAILARAIVSLVTSVVSRGSF